MTLEYNVSQLLKSNVGERRRYDFELAAPLDLDGATAYGIHGHVKFTLTNFGILAAITVEAELELSCARCLETFRTPVQVTFDEEYAPVIDIATGLPSTTPHSDAAFDISDTHTVDLTEAIRQHLVLAIEMVPLCSPDCKGLCPTCGVNLNVETCQCPPAEEPSPFAVLQGLMTESDSDR